MLEWERHMLEQEMRESARGWLDYAIAAKEGKQEPTMLDQLRDWWAN
jgi:hypothetical protein